MGIFICGKKLDDSAIEGCSCDVSVGCEGKCGAYFYCIICSSALDKPRQKEKRANNFGERLPSNILINAWEGSNSSIMYDVADILFQKGLDQ